MRRGRRAKKKRGKGGKKKTGERAASVFPGSGLLLSGFLAFEFPVSVHRKFSRKGWGWALDWRGLTGRFTPAAIGEVSSFGFAHAFLLLP